MMSKIKEMAILQQTERSMVTAMDMEYSSTIGAKDSTPTLDLKEWISWIWQTACIGRVMC